MKALVTGGAGFIGSALVRQLIAETASEVVTVDKLTYAGNEENLAAVAGDPRHAFERVDICDAQALSRIFAEHRPDAVFHLAAESHVDRSIDQAAPFIATNLVGTYSLLEAALDYWLGLDSAGRDGFRFVHVSTDEVYGALGPEGRHDEESRYRPTSPYAASKAGADHLALAWNATYGLPVIVSNCGNNYGPYQFPEKLIPLTISKGLTGEPIPVYGDGGNVRDWIFVDDHARALRLILERGRPGETYAVSAQCERTNLEIVGALCALLDEALPDSPHRPHAQLITHVADRPGHDWRYALDPGKLEAELGWAPRESLETGLRATVAWYVSNREWCARVREQSYGGERLGRLAARGSAARQA